MLDLQKEIYLINSYWFDFSNGTKQETEKT